MGEVLKLKPVPASPHIDFWESEIIGALVENPVGLEFDTLAEITALPPEKVERKIERMRRKNYVVFRGKRVAVSPNGVNVYELKRSKKPRSFKLTEIMSTKRKMILLTIFDAPRGTYTNELKNRYGYVEEHLRYLEEYGFIRREGKGKPRYVTTETSKQMIRRDLEDLRK